MNNGRVRWILWLTCLVSGLGWVAPAQTNEPQGPSLAVREKEECINNLKRIYEAIQAYQNDHKDIPNWLSDLVPDYLPDATVLVCPVCRRTGKVEAPPLTDPRLPTSYLFEFCPVPLGQQAPNAPTRTRREWKRRQMGLLGSVVPIVRCRHHTPVLNVAFDGHIYESPGMWELAFTNRVSQPELTAARLFANESSGQKPASTAAPARQFPKRDPAAGALLLDLTPQYNAMLTQAWHGGDSHNGNDLAALPAGLQTFSGIQFDTRGIIQLRSKSASSTNYPAEVKGIRVQQKCQRLHFLHAAGFGGLGDEGQQIGSYVVHFATNRMRLEIPILYGESVRNWHTVPGEPESKELRVAWTGENAVSRKAGRKIRLFLTTWTNLVPEVPIESIDFVSAMATPAPFLIAITAE